MSEPFHERDRTWEVWAGAGRRLLTRHEAFKRKEVVMRCLSALVLSVSAVGWMLPGCVADHASAIDEGDSMSDRVVQIPDEPADPNDPYGSCVDHDPDDDDDSPSCSIEGLGCWGWAEGEDCSGMNGSGECGFYQVWETCHHECEAASDCPVPATGDAVPACSDDHCTLPCHEDTACPDGFICASPNPTIATYPWVCVQYAAFEPLVIRP